MPLASIIIPIYNVEKYLVRCLDSVINQTLHNIEIILVNDCGNDNSWTIAQDCAAKDTRIVLIDSDCNHGPMKARENGCNQAKGEFVMFVDSDDYLPLDAVEILVKKQQEDDADIVLGGFVIKKINGEEEVYYEKLPYGNNTESLYKALLKGYFHHNLCFKLFKRKLFFEYAYQTYENMTKGEDACLFYQILSNTSFVTCTDKVVYYYILNSGSTTQKKSTLNQVRDVLICANVMLKTTSQYEDAHSICRQRVTYNVTNQFTKGLPHRDVHQLVEENGLQEFCTFRNIIKELSVKQLVTLCRRFIHNNVLR